MRKFTARAFEQEVGQLPGINVLQVVNGPTAAAYAHGVENKSEDKKNLSLVYDLVTGTLDVTVISMIGGNRSSAQEVIQNREKEISVTELSIG